ncbi:SKA3 protein, partial [Sakesphorus luctuosus]|nr:SKA3 protein [Sakesphorus luctuosus]
DSDDESPVTVLHDLRGEVQTLKEAVSASLDSSCSQRQAVHDFMKATEILMQRNAADLGKLRELFEKYGYKAHDKDSTEEEEEEEVDNESTVSVQNKSDEEKVKDILNLPTSTEKPLCPKNPLCKPQLSDFGLSQYAFSRLPLSAVKTQHTRSPHPQKSKNETPLKIQTPRSLPKTPKCRLKMDDYECVTPKFEHFGITEHTMCMNEDYTISLIHKTQTMNNHGFGSGDVLSAADTAQFKGFRSLRNTSTENNLLLAVAALCCLLCKPRLTNSFLFLLQCSLEKTPLDFHFLILKKTIAAVMLVKRNDNGGNVPDITPKRTMVTSVPKSNVRAKNADWMASPMGFVFCTPNMKVSSPKNNFQTRSPEKKELPPASPTATPPLPDFQTRWLKPEAKVVNSNSVCFHTLCHKQFLKCQHLIPLLQENSAKGKKYKESSVPFAVSPGEDPKHLGDPSPPTIKHCDQLLNTPPPPPEITRIPDDVLQILSKYNHKADFSKEMETKAGNATRYESDTTDCCNKENR